ncbi:MAG: hypothetical protein AB8G23_10995 [Myxococcota bacterium]
MTRSSLLSLCATLFLGLGASANAGAQELVTASPDITIGLASGATVTDEEAAVDNQLGVILTEAYAGLPVSADIVALSRDANGDSLLAFDTTLSLAGGIIASPGDVVRFDGSVYTTEFDASVEGVPAGVRTDAVSISSSGLILSFDTTASLPGGITVADEDLVRWTSGSYAVVMDGSASGLDSSLDIDAVQDLGGGAFAISLDTTGTAGGIVFADEDLMRWDGANWSLEYDASAADPNWIAADLNAVVVPEPGFAGLLVAGAALLVGFRKRS